MMFMEGLDETAINWVKQGTNADQQKLRYPLTERIAIQDPPSLCNAGYLSPSILPPLKFHSGFLGFRGSSFNLEDCDDDDESVASAPDHVDMDCSDSLEEDCQDSDDSDLFAKPSTVSCDDEVKSIYNYRSTLVRSKSKENLKIEVGDRRNTVSSGIINGYQHMGLLNSFPGDVGPPSAPPIMENGTRFTAGDEHRAKDIQECHTLRENKDHAHAHLMNEMKSFTINDVLDHPKVQLEHNDPYLRSNTKETEAINSCLKSDSVDQVTDYNVSGQNAWQTFIAYDSCFRLCLNAWARDCMEAPEFLQDECSVLRNAFGIQKYLLQPRGQTPKERKPEIRPECCTVKGKKVIGKFKVEVRKIRIVPRRKLQSTNSLRSMYATVGAQYIQTVSAIVKTKINSLKADTFPCPQEEVLSCYVQLKSSTLETQKDPSSIICLQPGNGDSHTFYPESQADALILEVQDWNKSVQGQATIPISSLTEDNEIDRLHWWPIYLDHNECVGKVQLLISCSSNSSEMRSIKSGPVVETFIYDLVLEAAMRSQHFHPRNLHIVGAWKWLLNEFADYYGVSDAYTKLRYLSFVMNVGTPTKDCLELVYELLLPVIEAHTGRNLNRQEKNLLLDCEAQVESLLATTFENYKTLDELSPTGLGNMNAPIPDFAAPALVPAVQIYILLHDILSQEAQSQLRNYLQTAALKRCKKNMIETDEYISSNYDIFTDPMNISTAYRKMKSLCLNINSEIQADIKIHNQHILPSSIDLPQITAAVYSYQLCRRLHDFLKACPPSKPSQHVIELLTTTADFERDLQSWNISPVHGGVDAKDLFHDYIIVWIQDMQLHLLELCKAEKVPWSGTSTHFSTSPFVENMYDQIKVGLSEYEVVVKRWPQYLFNLETVVSDIEHAILKALEKQYTEILTPLRDSIPKMLEKHVQKLTRRQSVSIYVVPDQLGIFLNTVKRMLDVLHGRLRDVMKSQAPCLTSAGDGKLVYGEQMNGIVVMLRKKYKNYVEAIVEKLIANTQPNRSTRLKRILEETKDTDGELEMRERMQTLCSQLSDSICNLHGAFSRRIFVTICRSFWDRMGQIVLNFLESRKENRVWYKASEYALGILDDLFASQMQTLLGHSLQEKDLDPPRSVMEARSILC